MDPNEALAVLRDRLITLVAWAEAEEWEVSPKALREHDADLIAVADAFTALDDWLSRDGFLPDDWRSDDEKVGLSRP